MNVFMLFVLFVGVLMDAFMLFVLFVGVDIHEHSYKQHK
jgi:hypothetical protein